MDLCATEEKKKREREKRREKPPAPSLELCLCTRTGCTEDTLWLTEARLYIPKQGEWGGGRATRWWRSSSETLSHRDVLLPAPCPCVQLLPASSSPPHTQPGVMGGRGGWGGGMVSAGRAVCQSSFMWVSSAAEASLSSVLCSSSPRRCDGAPAHLPPGCSPSSDCSPRWEGTSLITGFPNRGPSLSPLPPSLLFSLSPLTPLSLSLSCTALTTPPLSVPRRYNAEKGTHSVHQWLTACVIYNNITYLKYSQSQSK